MTEPIVRELLRALSVDPNVLFSIAMTAPATDTQTRDAVREMVQAWLA